MNEKLKSLFEKESCKIARIKIVLRLIEKKLKDGQIQSCQIFAQIGRGKHKNGKRQAHFKICFQYILDHPTKIY